MLKFSKKCTNDKHNANMFPLNNTKSKEKYFVNFVMKDYLFYILPYSILSKYEIFMRL